jgi:hypothetical protein
VNGHTVNWASFRSATVSPRSVILAAAVVSGLVLLFLLALTSTAQAKKTHLFLEELGGANPPELGNVGGLAIDQSTGDLLIIEVSTGVVSRWHEDGTPSDFPALGTNVIDGKGTGQCSTVPADCDQTPQNGFIFGGYPGEQQIAIDNSGTATDGNIYLTQGKEGSEHAVLIFSSSGEYLGRITAAGLAPFSGALTPCGVAVDPTGNLFVATGYEERIHKFDPSASVPQNTDHVASFSSAVVPCNLAAGAGPSAGALFANTFFADPVTKIDSVTGAAKYALVPDGGKLVSVDPATGHVFAYVDVEHVDDEEIREFDASGASGATKFADFKESPNGLAIRGSTGKVYVGWAVQQSGEVRVYGPAVTVPDVLTGSATITGDTSVTLNGTVNPDGVAVDDCHFEYGPNATYGTTVPCAESSGEIGTGQTPVTVHADLTGLAIESSYHFRLVAGNVNDTIEGKDQTFLTPSKPEITAQWASGVKPTEATLNASINPGNSPTTYHIEWGPDTAYGNTTPELPVGSDASEHTVSQTLSGLDPQTTYHWRVVIENNIGSDVGEDRSFTTYGEAALALPDDRAYELVSPPNKNGGEVAVPTAAGGAAEQSVEPLQASPSGEAITYGSYTAFGEGAQSAAATSQYLSSRGASGWSTANINPRFEEGFLSAPIVGFSRDLAFAAAAVVEPELTPDAMVDLPNIYRRENASGAYEALTTEAQKALFPAGCLVFGGMSDDGQVVAFAAGPKLFQWSPGEGAELVSVLLNGNPSTVAATFGAGAPALNCNMEEAKVRHAVSADGSRIFWKYSGTTGGAFQPLLARIDGEATIQIDAPNTGTAGKGGEGVYEDASVDGSKVFFTTTKPLTSAPTTLGARDLFLYDFGQPAGERLTNLSANAGEAAGVQRVIGTSEDGSYAYFVADGVLAPGGIAGKANLYAWHAGDGIRHVLTADLGETKVAALGGHLLFTSTEALTGFDNLRPGGCRLLDKGGFFGDPACEEVFLYEFSSEEISCVSCNAAGTAPEGPALLAAASNPYEEPRSISADGDRAFFETFDALDPHDTNAKRDVYQFERPGTGDCSEASPTFNAGAGGCVALISSGQSEDETYFLDASESGDDVFISTREGLVFNDEDGRYDVYDARVGGSSPVPPPPGCEGEACRGPATADPGTPAPGTSAFEGPGDPPPKRGCPKDRRQVQRAGKARCVKKQGRKANKRRGKASKKGRAGR